MNNFLKHQFGGKLRARGRLLPPNKTLAIKSNKEINLIFIEKFSLGELSIKIDCIRGQSMHTFSKKGYDRIDT